MVGTVLERTRWKDGPIDNKLTDVVAIVRDLTTNPDVPVSMKLICGDVEEKIFALAEEFKKIEMK